MFGKIIGTGSYVPEKILKTMTWRSLLKLMTNGLGAYRCGAETCYGR